MRKLKLESLQVESFETVAAQPAGRGTVHGHRPNTDGCAITIQPGTGVSDCIICQPVSWNGCESIQICKDTEYLDCTYGCTRNTCDARINSCGDVCWIENTADGCTIVG
ncbi:MAG TPA: pinensin family lanthipeptide [Longimicrobium sp.]|nr:pinensin family lanthipeptide [Longimicrobium sp.]